MKQEDPIRTLLEQHVASFEGEPEEWLDVLARCEKKVVSITRPRRRAFVPHSGTKRRWAFRASLAAAVAVVAGVGALLAPGNQRTFISMAAAAIPDSGPVVHLVLSEEPDPNDQPYVLDLSSGSLERSTARGRTDMWWDPDQHIFKWIFGGPKIKGAQVWRDDTHALSSGGEMALGDLPIPPVVVFFGHYKEALSSGQATLVGKATIDGHEVFVLRVLTDSPAPPASLHFEGTNIPTSNMIAIDKRTYQPVAYWLGDSPTPSTEVGALVHITSVELVSRDQADLAPPVVWKEPFVETNDMYGYGVVPQSHEIDQAAVAGWLGQEPIGLRKTLAGRDFTLAQADVLNKSGSPELRGVELVYGETCSNGKPKAGGDYVVVQESKVQATRAYANYLLPRQKLSSSLYVYKSGVSSSQTCGGPSYMSGIKKPTLRWYAGFYLDGLYVSVTSPSRDLVVQATLSLLGDRVGKG